MWPWSRQSTNADNLGMRGEKLAARMLKRKGGRILARNYRCPAGEVDLICLDCSARSRDGVETIVFVEVKTRTSDRYTDPEYAVDAAKQRRLKKIARYYLARREAEGFNVRFDIVSAVIIDGQEPQLRHIEDAFR